MDPDPEGSKTGGSGSGTLCFCIPFLMQGDDRSDLTIEKKAKHNAENTGSHPSGNITLLVRCDLGYRRHGQTRRRSLSNISGMCSKAKVLRGRCDKKPVFF